MGRILHFDFSLFLFSRSVRLFIIFDIIRGLGVRPSAIIVSASLRCGHLVPGLWIRILGRLLVSRHRDVAAVVVLAGEGGGDVAVSSVKDGSQWFARYGLLIDVRHHLLVMRRSTERFLMSFMPLHVRPKSCQSNCDDSSPNQQSSPKPRRRGGGNHTSHGFNNLKV